MRTRFFRAIVLGGALPTLAACGGGGHPQQSASNPTVQLTLSPTTVMRGGRVRISWSSSDATACVASGAWSGDQERSGAAMSPALTKSVDIFSLRCIGPGGSARASAVVTVPGGRESGLDFQGSASTTGTVRFRFTKPLRIYPATYIWCVYVRSQPEYYTTFFWGNDGEFRWDKNRFSNSYYGAHPYPYPAPHFVAPEDVGPRHWEIAVAGLDVLSKETVEYGRWHVQALRVWSDTRGKHHEFYWDLPDTKRVIRHDESRRYGNKPPPKPTLTWGDAPWNPSNEIMNGVIRGIRIYSTLLSQRDMLSESSKPLSTRDGAAHVWYLNLDPTPEDIADQSGSANEPEWVGPERPLLWARH
jgi:hypothetical protein